MRVEPELDASTVKVNRIDLVERLSPAARTQVAAHEARLKLLEPSDATSEGHAKALATLARTLRQPSTASTRFDRSLREGWLGLGIAEQERWIARLTPAEIARWLSDWLFWARDDQLPAAHEAWSTWLTGLSHH